MRLERDVAIWREQQQGIIHQICGKFLDPSQRASSRPFAVLWLPMRIAGWFFWVPIRLGSLTISTYGYLMKKALRTAGDAFGKGKWSLAADESVNDEDSPV